VKREDFSFTSKDGLKIACYRWPSAAKPIGVLQIAHGMGEHALRYGRAAEAFSNAGFQVYANDHRGHGRTAENKDALGNFGEGGWDALVDDMVALTRLIRSREGALPIVLLGHSMGSFATQQYLLDHSDLIAAAVISGSASVDKLPMDPSQPADLTVMNAAFEPARTPFDWLRPRSERSGRIRCRPVMRIRN